MTYFKQPGRQIDCSIQVLPCISSVIGLVGNEGTGVLSSVYQWVQWSVLHAAVHYHSKRPTSH